MTLLPRWATTAVNVWLSTLALAAAAQGPRPKPLENPTAADLQSGASLFVASCGRCHGLDGSGGAGPPLTRPKLRRAGDEAGIIDIIVDGIPGTAMPAAAGWMLSESEVARVASYVRSIGRRPVEKLPGDPMAGHAVYARSRCAGCHVVDGTGTAVGPELTNIGMLRGSAFLRESLVDPGASRPQRSVPYEPYSYPAYVIVRVKPRGASEVAGIRLNEDSFTIQLRDQTGRIHSFQKTQLESLRAEPNTSLMPSYRSTLSIHELDDLVAYLMTLGEQQ
jgi:cytochrome c oxidase cbb3-type subunit 3